MKSYYALLFLFTFISANCLPAMSRNLASTWGVMSSAKLHETELLFGADEDGVVADGDSLENESSTSVNIGKDGLSIKHERIENLEVTRPKKILVGIQGIVGLGTKGSMLGTVAVPIYISKHQWPVDEEKKMKGLYLSPRFYFMNVKIDNSFATDSNMTTIGYGAAVSYFWLDFKFKDAEKKQLKGKGWRVGLSYMKYSLKYKADFGFGEINIDEDISMPGLDIGYELFNFNPTKQKYTSWTFSGTIGSEIMLIVGYSTFF